MRSAQSQSEPWIEHVRRCRVERRWPVRLHSLAVPVAQIIYVVSEKTKEKSKTSSIVIIGLSHSPYAVCFFLRAPPLCTQCASKKRSCTIVFLFLRRRPGTDGRGQSASLPVRHPLKR